MNIDQLISHLSAAYADGHPPEVQKAAVAELARLVTDADLEKLLQPFTKSYWSNAAKVLEFVGFPRIKRVEPGLLRWLQDLNWPGARTVYALLLHLREEEFLPMMERALVMADQENDRVWISSLQTLIEDKEVTGKLSPAFQAILKKSDS